MAEAFSIAVGDFLSKSANSYFRKYGRLAPQDLPVSSVTNLTGAEAFQTLLTAVKNSRQNSFLLYVHGFSDGGGLFLKLALRRGAPTGADTTAVVLDLLTRLDGRAKAASDRELATLGIGGAEAQTLLGLMRDVRAKNIETIEFRGCNLGRNLNSVETFKKFFGAKTFGAPDLFSFFGVNTVNVGQGFVDRHRDHRPSGDWHEFPYKLENPSGTLVVNVATDGNLRPVQGYIVADSIDTVQRWVKQHIDPDGTYNTRDGGLTLHGMWDTGRRKVDPVAITDAPIGAEQPLPGPEIILPLESEYKKHVIYG